MFSIGIDLGSSKIVLQQCKPQGPQVILSESSSRFLPNIISILPNERLICTESAQQKLKTNFQNTVQFPQRHLRSQDNCYLTCKYKEDVLSLNQQDIKVVQLIGMIFSKIKKLLNKQNIQNYIIGLSYPNYFTENEIQNYKNAAQISDFPLGLTIPENQCVAMSYYFFNFQNSCNILFIDIGYCKTSIYQIKFENKHIQILKNQDFFQIGVRNIDYKILDYIFCILKNQYKINVDSIKLKMRLLDIIDKQRKILSSNNDTIFNIELDDQDIEIKFSRQDLENLIKEEIDFEQMINNEQFQDFDHIQLLGGGTRIPYFQNIIKELFPNIQIQRTLNSEECISQGAAIIQAKSILKSDKSKVIIEDLSEKNQQEIVNIDDQNQIQQFKHQEQIWIQNDNELEETLILKNELESYIIDKLQLIQSDYQKLDLDHKIFNKLQDKIQIKKNWFDENHLQANKNTINLQLQEIKKVTQKQFQMFDLKLSLINDQQSFDKFKDIKKNQNKSFISIILDLQNQNIDNGDNLMNYLFNGLKKYFKYLSRMNIEKQIILKLNGNCFNDRGLIYMQQFLKQNQNLEWIELYLHKNDKLTLNGIKESLQSLKDFKILKFFKITCDFIDKDFFNFFNQIFQRHQHLAYIEFQDNKKIDSDTLEYFKQQFQSSDIEFKYSKY